MTKKQPKLIYLAAPYSHDNIKVEQWRFFEVTRFAGKLIENGYHVFSPITMFNEITRECPEINGSWEYWKAFFLRMIDICDEVMVFKLPGWHISSGLEAEVDYANDIDKPVKFIKFNGKEGVLNE